MQHISYTLKPDSCTAVPKRLTACSTLHLCVSVQKLIWDHCYVSCTSTVVVAWLDCMAIKHSKALLPIECLIYTVCIIVCLVCLIYTLHWIINLFIVSRFLPISEMIPLACLLVGEHWGSMKADMRTQWYAMVAQKEWLAHSHFETRNRSTVTAEVSLTFHPSPHLSILPSPWWSVQGSRGEAESEWYTYYSLSLSILFPWWLTGPVWPNLGGKWL